MLHFDNKMLNSQQHMVFCFNIYQLSYQTLTTMPKYIISSEYVTLLSYICAVTNTIFQWQDINLIFSNSCWTNCSLFVCNKLDWLCVFVHTGISNDWEWGFKGGMVYDREITGSNLILLNCLNHRDWVMHEEEVG